MSAPIPTDVNSNSWFRVSPYGRTILHAVMSADAAYNQDLAGLRDQLAVAVASRDTAEAALAALTAASAAQLAAEQLALADSTREVNRLTAALLTSEAEVTRLTSALAESATNTAQLTTTLQASESSFRRQADALTAANTTVTHLQTALAACQAALTAAQRDSVALVDSYEARLRDQTAAAQAAYTAAETSLTAQAQSSSRIHDLSDRLASLQALLPSEASTADPSAPAPTPTMAPPSIPSAEAATMTDPLVLPPPDFDLLLAIRPASPQDPLRIWLNSVLAASSIDHFVRCIQLAVAYYRNRYG